MSSKLRRGFSNVDQHQSHLEAALSYPLNKRPDVVVLGNNDGYVRYHQLDLRVLDGTATLLRPPPPGAVTSP